MRSGAAFATIGFTVLLLLSSAPGPLPSASADPAVPSPAPAFSSSGSASSSAWTATAQTATVASFGDWPQEAHDGARTGYDPQEATLNASNISSLRLVWSTELADPIYGSPIVVNGTVFVGDLNANLYALRAADGQVLWHTKLGGSANYTNCRALGGIGGTPAYWNGTVYVVGGSPALYAVNASNGTVLWSVDVANDSSGLWRAHYGWASPLLYNGTAYVGMASGCDTPLVAGQVLAINLRGAAHSIQSVFSATSASQDGGGVWRAPAVDGATGVIYATTGNENASCTCASSQVYTRALLKLRASNLSLLGYYQTSSVGCDCDFGTSPLVARVGSNTTFVEAMNKDGTAYLFDPSGLNTAGTGGLAARTSVGAAGRARSGAAFDGRNLFTAGGATTLANGTYCLGSVSAVSLTSPLGGWPPYGWQYCAPADIQAGLALADGLLVFFAVNTPTWTTDRFQIVDAKNGSLLYTSSLNQSVFSGAAVADGRIFVDTINGTQFGPSYVDAFGLPLAANATASPAGANGSVQLAVRPTGGAPPYRCAWWFGDGTNGIGCSGTKSYASSGSYPVTVLVTDADGESVNVSSSVTVTVPAPPLVASMIASRSSFDLGLSTEFVVSVTGGSPPYSFAYLGLPAGCASANVSALSCQPTGTGLSTVLAQVRDRSGNETGSAVGVLVEPDPVVGAFLAAPATIILGNSTSLVVIASGGTAPLTYTYHGLPAPCGTDNRDDLVCTPQAVGAYAIETVVTDGDGRNATAWTNLTVVAQNLTAMPLEVSAFVAAPDPVAVDGTLDLVVATAGGSAPYTYRYTGLPPGCASVNASYFTCAPARAGSFAPRVTVTDGRGSTAKSTARIDVLQAANSTATAPPGAPALPAVAIAVAAVAGIALGWWFGRRRNRPS